MLLRAFVRACVPVVAAVVAVAVPAVADDDVPPPSLLVVDAVDPDTGAGQVTVEGPLNVDGSIALGPRIGLILSQSEVAREGWAPLIGRRVRARGKVQPGTRKRGARFLLRLVTPRRPEAIDDAPDPARPLAPWPRVPARIVARGVLDDEGRVLVSRGVAIELLLPRPATLARCAGRRVEVTGEVLSDPWLHEGVRRFVLDSSLATLLEEAPAPAPEGTAGIVDGLPGR